MDFARKLSLMVVQLPCNIEDGYCTEFLAVLSMVLQKERSHRQRYLTI
jgi:hypothetical protein